MLNTLKTFISHLYASFESWLLKLLNIFFNFRCFILCALVYYLHVCICARYMPHVHGGQKRVFDPFGTRVIDVFWWPCRFWKTTLDPMKEWQMFSTTETSLYNPFLKNYLVRFLDVWGFCCYCIHIPNTNLLLSL